MRCLALAQCLLADRWQPWLVGDFAGVPLVDRAATAAGVLVRQSVGSVADTARRSLFDGADLVVLDGYSVSRTAVTALLRRGLHIAAIGDLPGQWPDVPLVVNPNHGAERIEASGPHQRILAGLRYALLRDEVVRRRPAAGRRVQPTCRRVLVVAGGTDPQGVGPHLVRALLATGRPLDITLVAPRRDTAEATRRLPTADGQHVRVSGPIDDLPALAGATDLVVGAAGLSMWEWACLGVPAAVTCVADNQRAGYERAVADELVVGLGSSDDIRADPAAASRTLYGLLADAELRARLSAVGWRAVDGAGRQRVVAALRALVDGGLVADVGDMCHRGNKP